MQKIGPFWQKIVRQCSYLSPTTCPNTTPNAVKTADDKEIAPLRCLGALSPKYMGCTFMLMPAKHAAKCLLKIYWCIGFIVIVSIALLMHHPCQSACIMNAQSMTENSDSITGVQWQWHEKMTYRHLFQPGHVRLWSSQKTWQLYLSQLRVHHSWGKCCSTTSISSFERVREDKINGLPAKQSD